MRKVKLFCDWDNDSAGLIETLKRQSLGWNDDSYGGLEFVSGDEYDYAVVFNWAWDGVTAPPERCIGLVLEPAEILDWLYRGWQDYNLSGASTYYSFTDLPGYEKAYGVGFATAPIAEYLPLEERAPACMVVSHKVMTPYQEKRREVFSALAARDNGIDFYGRGMSVTGRCRGEIPPMRKDLTIQNYLVVIDFENSMNALTDKFFDPVICGSMPLTNSQLIDGAVDFTQSVDEIVEAVESVVTQDIEVLRKQVVASRECYFDAVTQGKFCLTKWISDKIVEL